MTKGKRGFHKEHLGKKKGSMLFYGIGSIMEYDNGYKIKAINEERITLSKRFGEYLAHIIRNKNQLFTKKEYEKIISKEIAEKI